MPIYEYQCKKCGHAFEHLHNTSDLSAPACPECGAANPEKVLSSFSVNRSPSFGGGHTCCGVSDPSQAGCAGPGSCCSSKKE
jgi:putative FmdB family regulatory protein